MNERLDDPLQRKNVRRTGTQFSRRSLLKYAGPVGAVALAPFVPILNSEAQETSSPKRIIFVVTHNGTVMDEFFPDATGRDFALKRVLSPLEPFRERMTLLGNVNMDPAPGGAHTGMGMLLTNTIPNDDRIGMGISVDQFIGQQIGGETPFETILLGNNSHANGEVFLRGAQDPIPAENNPYVSFERLFGNFTGDPEAEMLAARRGSVIDSVLGDLNAFRGTVPPEDRKLIDLHLESLRSVERSVTSDLLCSAPELADLDVNGAAHMPEISRLNNELVVAALRCGLTRVVAMPFLRPVGDYVLSFLGINDGVHTISHNGVEDSLEKFTVINHWFSEQVADLVQRLADAPDGEGSLLDNTLVVMCNECSDGARHSKENLPICMIGGDWYFDVGQYRQFSQEPHGKWLVSLCQAMGVDVPSFGREETSQGPLPGISIS